MKTLFVHIVMLFFAVLTFAVIAFLLASIASLEWALIYVTVLGAAFALFTLVVIIRAIWWVLSGLYKAINRAHREA